MSGWSCLSGVDGNILSVQTQRRCKKIQEGGGVFSLHTLPRWVWWIMKVSTMRAITQRTGKGWGASGKKALYKLVGPFPPVTQGRDEDEVDCLCQQPAGSKSMPLFLLCGHSLSLQDRAAPAAFWAD